MEIAYNTNLKIYIVNRMDSFVTEIWLIDDKGYDEMYNIAYDSTSKLLVREKISMQDHPEHPLLSLPKPMMQILFKAIMEQQEKQGIKTKDENLIEGKLIATEKHLEDMREFAKKLLDNKLLWVGLDKGE